MNLGNTLKDQGQLDEAIQMLRAGLDLDPKVALAHYNLGGALYDKGALQDAIREWREAIRLDPKFAPAHDNLAVGQRMLTLENQLATVLEGKKKPADAAECLGLAELCQQPFKKRFVTSARFYAEAFADDAKLADDMQQQHRYNAACAAALAGCGQGEEAGKLDDTERAGLRKTAQTWLRADLAFWTKEAERDNSKARETVQATLKHWQTDTDLAGVRDQKALEKLPEEERKQWQQLWADVASLLRRAERK